MIKAGEMARKVLDAPDQLDGLPLGACSSPPHALMHAAPATATIVASTNGSAAAAT